MRRAVHILAWLPAATLVLLAAPAGADPVAPPPPPPDHEPPFTDRQTTGEGEHRAGFVVDDGEEVRTFCIRFDEEELTGQELMERAPLELETTHFGALGAATCAIDGIGCPAGDCFCTGAYWSYWQGDDEDGWSSSPVGSSSRTVRDGDRDARLWTDGRREPRPISLGEICDQDLATPAPTTPPADALDGPVEEPEGDTLADPATLASFVVILALLLAAVWWVRRSR